MITKFLNFLFENKQMIIPQDILNLHDIFKSKNKELMLVGGCVRDLIMGIKPHDFDLVTNAKPDEIIKILKDKYRVDLQGKQFGVVRVFTKNFPEGLEIASYRKDLSKGRDNKSDTQKVDIETADIYSDSQRRDLKMNALYYDIDKQEIVDLVGGLEDINKNIISAVGNPSERFIEDRLRILRTIRFASRNISKISINTENAIKSDKRLRNISIIDDVSQERIIEEFMKAISWSIDQKNLNSLNYYLQLLDEYELFEEMFPNLTINIDNIISLNIFIILALLFRDNNIDYLKNQLKINKFPNNIVNVIYFLLKFKNEINNVNNIPALYKEKIRFKIKNDTINQFANILNFNNNFVKAFLKYEPKINTVELINLGFKNIELGKEIKKREIEQFKELL